MHDDRNKPELANYRLFVSRLDELCDKINRQDAGLISCRAGCSSCCRHLTIFPVEAAALADALTALPDGDRLALASLEAMPENGPCPLLKDDRCLAYGDRPVICRTHGLPLLTEIDGEKRIDHCPDNYRDINSFSGDRIINLDMVNRTLVAINGVFVRETIDPEFRSRERLSIARIVRLSLTAPR